MMKHLVIGKTSQLAHYFPMENFEFVGSRDIDVGTISEERWDRIYICAAEQRTFLKNVDFAYYNIEATINLIDQIKESCNKVIVYSTTELWNETAGAIALDTPHCFKRTPYILSKKAMTQRILTNRADYNNVIILYPFNFNSTMRHPGFLFGKIFDSIINKKKIEIGDTYFYRELLHPKFVALQSILADKHTIIGSGRVVFVNDFIRDLYAHFGLQYEDYVIEKIDKKGPKDQSIFFLNSQKCLYPYGELFADTVEDLSSKIKWETA